MSVGELLRLARESQGLTQTELEELTGVAQGHISRYEREQAEPRDATIQRLSEGLGVTSEFFELPAYARAATAVTAHARRRKTGTAAKWRQLEARINMHRLRLQGLVRGMDVHSPLELSSYPAAEGYEAAEAARLVRMQWRMPLGPVHNLVGWVEGTGAIVVLEEFGTSRIDGLSQWEGDPPIFLLNSRAPVDRRRWTLAHELAHLVLHPDPVEGMESEADAFAAEFLMPEAEIRSQLKRVTLSRLLPLKIQWMVSLQALIMRAYGLGLIDDDRRRSLYKQLSARGYRQREPESDMLPEETPQLLAELVGARRASGDDLAALQRAAFIAHTNDHDARCLLPGALSETLRLVT